MTGRGAFRSAMTGRIKRLVGRRRTAQVQFLRRRGWGYWPIAAYQDIPGWLTEREATTLFDLARTLPAEHPVAVEIGSFLGKSSVVIAKGMTGKRDAALYCIDPFNADGEDFSRPQYAELASEQPTSLEAQFRANVRRFGVEAVVRPLVGYSNDVVHDFSAPIDFLFIDGNHAYDAVLQDYLDWSPRLVPGAVLAFHDADHEGPRAVIDEFIATSPEWTDRGQADSLYHARRRPGTR